MTDWTRDELHDFARDFAWPETAEDEREDRDTALPAAGRGESATSAPTGRHDFAASPNPRNKQACARCGRTAENPIHVHPEMQMAAAICACDRAVKSLREGNRDYALSEISFALRVLRGEV